MIYSRFSFDTFNISYKKTTSCFKVPSWAITAIVVAGNRNPSAENAAHLNKGFLTLTCTGETFMQRYPRRNNLFKNMDINPCPLPCGM